MLVSDLLHSCTNDRVAAAAVCSIGGPFAFHVQASADRHGVTIGAYAARMVREFAISATEREWRDLVIACRGADHPVLAGLQLIVDRRSGSKGQFTGRSQIVPAAMAAA